ncbi:MAG: hypothetical protein OXG85_16575 [Chloroflexi bacterium]|nr:hypothetical protein [Chloroflexota bacterium]
MKTYTMESAVANFDELMEDAQKGLTIYIIGSDGREYELILKRMPENKPRKPGMFKGQIKIAEDFDDPLPEFEPYMK